MTTSITNAAAIAACDAIVDRVDQGAGAGKLKIYSGAVPTDADTALGAQVLLATLVFSDPAFGAAADSAGEATATANAITSDLSADATDTASFFRVADSNDVVLWQGTVGTAGAQLNLNTTSIVAGAEVAVTAYTFVFNETGPD